MSDHPTVLADDLVGIDLDDDEVELVALELEPLLGALTGSRREAHLLLRETVDEEHVPPELTPVLGAVVELALQTGRARRLYTAEGEKVLTALYRRTPQGRSAAAHVTELNDALHVLTGETVEGVSVRMRSAGHATITMVTHGATVTLSARADGVRLESLVPGPGRTGQAAPTSA